MEMGQRKFNTLPREKWTFVSNSNYKNKFCFDQECTNFVNLFLISEHIIWPKHFKALKLYRDKTGQELPKYVQPTVPLTKGLCRRESKKWLIRINFEPCEIIKHACVHSCQIFDNLKN